MITYPANLLCKWKFLFHLIYLSLGGPCTEFKTLISRQNINQPGRFGFAGKIVFWPSVAFFLKDRINKIIWIY